MRLLLFATFAALLSTVASAQDVVKVDDSLVTNLAAQWQAAQTGQQNVADVLGKLIEAYRREKARADAAEAKLKVVKE